MSFIILSNINKSFGTTQVVKAFDLSLEKGEFVSLLGPSGCGKTTVLRMLAGFESPSSGDIRIDGESVVAQRPNQRRIGMVFQSYALFPNLTVAGNVAFGLKVGGQSRADISRRVDEMLELVGLSGFGPRYPFQLSGGQQQRVALARAIAPRPRVLLLDEPLSALDAKIRVSLRSEIRSIQRELGITTLFVTHDQEEALGMSDRVVVMHEGRAEQIGTPADVYNRPATRFVASFIGTLNLIDGTLTDPGQGIISTTAGTISLGHGIDRQNGSAVTLAIRPQSLRLDENTGLILTGDIDNIEFLGSIIRLKVATRHGSLVVDCFNRDLKNEISIGERVNLSIEPDEVAIL